MSETMMHPATRKLTQITVNDIEKMNNTFELLLGDALADRKQYIEEHLHEYVAMADV
jgi:DNA gyrase subunit B